MGSLIIDIENVEYFQRAREEDHPLQIPDGIRRVLGDARMWHIPEIGRLEKRPAPAPSDERKYRLPTEDLLIAMFGLRLPIAFLTRGNAAEAQIQLGVWSPGGSQSISDNLDANAAVLQAALHSLYPVIKTVKITPDLFGLSMSGFALGIPTAQPPDPQDREVGLDRLIRALHGTNWGCLVLAEPVEEKDTLTQRRRVVAELRVAEEAKIEHAPEDLIKHYSELLGASLSTLTQGLAVGMWRVGVYLLGDAHGYPRLASLWRGIFSGDESLVEPVRVWRDPNVAHLASDFVLPDEPGRKGPEPSHFKHPWEYQTLLNSKQLAAYIHFPERETSGFAIRAVPDFDKVPATVESNETVQVGKVLLGSEPTGTEGAGADYVVQRDDLTRHAFVAGVTGAGKTNTIFHLLQELHRARVKFLVIEPAKREYRLLLNHRELKDQLHIFTLGDELTSPFRLNPFEVVGYPKNSVGVHLDLLRSVFSASFGMWTPLPQILEQCLYRIYEDRGWDITSNHNPRLDDPSDPTPAFPTLSDLAAKAEEIIGQLGFDEDATSRIRGSLLTRINSLRTGGKGRMLDTQRSIPMELLLNHPTVLELEGMGDDDDKAFVMGLMFIRLVEQQRKSGQSKRLKHLLVIEEAHRLLTNVGERREDEGNARGKAVESFANLLAEIRAYGQGVLISDQVPEKLAPDVIKNTNLKITHRTVAADDRSILAGAMAMNEQQARALAILERGQAAVFSEYDDAPLLIKVEPVKEDLSNEEMPDGDDVRKAMATRAELVRERSFYLSRSADAELSPSTGPETELARQMVQEPAFRRLFAKLALTAMEDIRAATRLWPEIVLLVDARRSADMDENKFLRVLANQAAKWFSERRGSQAGWTYSTTAKLEEGLSQLLLAVVNDPSQNAAAVKTAAGDYQKCALEIHQRSSDPFPACGRICKKPVCLYRYAAADLIQSGDYSSAWRSAEEADLDVGTESGSTNREKVADDAGLELVGPPETNPTRDDFDAANRASLCFAQQMLAADQTKPLSTLEKRLESAVGSLGPMEEEENG
jgi:hypothetical protein